MDPDDERFTIAYYCTGHGFGHLSRSYEIITKLVAAGHLVTVVTGAPVHLFSSTLPAGLTVRRAILDTGAKQKDAFTVDQKGSLEEYIAIAGGSRRTEIIDEETAWLRDHEIDLVVSDIVPLACVAAATAAVPCVAVSNFSWDFIYSEYLTAAGSVFRNLVWQIADDYACALKLLRLPGYVPMPAFREVLDVPLVVRHAQRSPSEVRDSLSIPQDCKLVCFIYGGQPPGADWHLRESSLPPNWMCIVCGAGQPPGGDPLPSNFILAPIDVYTPDVIVACDVVMGKIGYGTTSECLAHHRPMVFLRRDFFNEEPFLRNLLELNDSAVEMKRRDFISGNWTPYLERAAALTPRYSEPTNGADVVAAELINTARDYKFAENHHSGTVSFLTPSSSRELPSPSRTSSSGNYHHHHHHHAVGTSTAPKHPGQSRLRDTIAWGYIMARHALREHSDVPEWYTRGQIPWATTTSTTTTTSIATTSTTENASKNVEEVTGSDVETLFEILEGPGSNVLTQFPDTKRFLSLVGSLLEDHASTPTTTSPSPSPSSSSFSATQEKEKSSSSHHPSPFAQSKSSTGSKSNKSISSQESIPVLPELRAAAGLFLHDEPLFISRAPGRLDVMGGIADYSGSTVLQMPIAEAAHVALQLQSPRHQRLWRHMQHRHATTTAAVPTTSATTAAGTAGIAPLSSTAIESESSMKSIHHHPPRSSSPALRIVSLNADATNRGPAFDMDLTELITPNGDCVSYAHAREYFKRDPALSWAAYIAGGLVVLMREKGVKPVHGIAMLVSSEVPEGKGVSSSAAVEIASMQALAEAHGVLLTGRELALLCQKVENLVVGAPCGVMDQMASALGESGWLLALKCQPAEVEGAVPLPPHLRFWGVDSGIRHSVGGSDYGAVRVGAFMGLKILSNAMRKKNLNVASSITTTTTTTAETSTQASPSFSSSSELEAKEQETASHKEEEGLVGGGGYLANIAPSTFSRHLEHSLPETITGRQFLDTYGPHLDSATVIDPEKTYAVKIPTAHPIFENFRVLAFRQALAAHGTTSQQQLEVLGELMVQSHVSYSACGLGSEGTDRLVEFVMEERGAAEVMGKEPSLYGAKITGGGCGGTVCVVGTADEAGEEALQRVVARYEAATGHSPYVFEGTSEGAVGFGVMKVQRRKTSLSCCV